MYCFDDYSIAIHESLRFGIFTAEIPTIIYYSHITAIVVTLLLGLFVYAKSRALPAKILFAISITFSALAILDILLWTQVSASMVMFIWSFWLTLFILIFGLSFYFLYTFIRKRDIHFLYKLLFVAILVIIEFFSATTLNLQYFDLDWCEAAEGFWMLNAVFGLSGLIFLGTVLFGLNESRKIQGNDERKKSYLSTIGIGCFLLTFSAATYLASIISLFFADGNFVFLTEQYGYFGMTIFIGFLAYIIVRYQAFKIKTIAASVLVVILVLLIASQFLFIRSDTGTVLTGITLLLAIAFGYLLIKSVRREVRQREEIEQLAEKLEKANKRLKVLDQMKSEFVSIASHQLRSPLTSIRGYASMLLEGTYGKLSKKGKMAVERIAESSRYMALSVEDYLNVSRIEAGRMKYEMSDFNLKDMAEKIVDDVRPAAVKKGLLLTFKSSNLDSKGMVHGDIGKTQQIIHNLLDNSMKYTPEGSIAVTVDDNKKKKRVSVAITDTGVGMDKETAEEVFEKFIRARNANEVNVTGTGLGLYVARQMAEGMNGQITAVSAGKGKGSTFTLELPMTK